MTFLWILFLVPPLVSSCRPEALGQVEDLAHRWGLNSIVVVSHDPIDHDKTLGLRQDTLTLHIKASELFQVKLLSQSLIYVCHGGPDDIVLQARDLGWLEQASWLLESEISIPLGLKLNSNVYVMTNQTLNEIYAIKGEKVEQPVGRWDAEKGWIIPEPEMWSRRRDLRRVSLINYLVLGFAPPLLIAQTVNDSVQSSGYLADLLLELSRIMNFEVVNEAKPGLSFGSIDANGTWNGMVGVLSRKEADISTAGISITDQRVKAIDFTVPIFEEPITIIQKKPEGRSLNFWAYLTAFRMPVWIILGLTLFILALGLVLVSVFDHGLFVKSEKWVILNCLAFVTINLMQRDYRIQVLGRTSKILTFVIATFGFVTFSGYTALMTSSMTVLELKSPIKDYQDVLEFGYQMVTLKDSSLETILKTSPPDSVLSNIYHKTMVNNSKALLGTINALFQAVEQDAYTVFFGPGSTSYVNDKFVALNLPGSEISYKGFGLQKDSELTDIFNYFLLRLKQSGILKRIFNKWFHRETEFGSAKEEPVVALALNYDNILFPFCLLAFGVISAGVVIIPEMVLKRFYRFKMKQNPISRERNRGLVLAEGARPRQL